MKEGRDFECNLQREEEGCLRKDPMKLHSIKTQAWRGDISFCVALSTTRFCYSFLFKFPYPLLYQLYFPQFPLHSNVSSYTFVTPITTYNLFSFNDIFFSNCDGRGYKKPSINPFQNLLQDQLPNSFQLLSELSDFSPFHVLGFNYNIRCFQLL